MAAAYVWAAGIKGTQYSDGEATDVDVKFEDLFDKLKYAFMGYFEARRGKFSVGLDVSTLKLEDTRDGPLNLGFDLTQTIVDLNVGYALIDCVKGYSKWGTCCYPRRMMLDVLVGARWWDLEANVGIVPPGAGPITRTKSIDWIDPYIGARWRSQWAKRWAVAVYGDFGGFGISDASETTYKFQALVRYSISRSFFIGLGYRVLDVDRIEGTGATRNGVNATYHGPFLGAGFTF